MTFVDAPDRPEVDPRIAQRRLEVEAQRRRRRHRARVVVGAVVVLAVTVWGLSRTDLAAVDEVVVRGAERTGAGAVEVASGIDVGDQLTDVDLRRSGLAVSRLPWVERAELERRWWDRQVVITVHERVPTAVVSDPTGTQFAVDAEGWVLAEVAAPGVVGLGAVVPITVPTMVEVGAELDEWGRSGLVIAAALSPGVASRVERVEITTDGPELALRPAGRVRLGGPTELDVKVRTLQTIFATVDLRCLLTLDVQVVDTAVITREEGFDPLVVEPDTPPLTTWNDMVGHWSAQGEWVEVGTLPEEDECG
ncbi:MAG: FtsQ-type POTRA domain-containing protein [Acidimicrobiia bacterium]|nr:FtsQ-type POTRA domain-containing protein [Acidimicrobiia bacterium]